MLVVHYYKQSNNSENFLQTRDGNYIYRNDLDETRFQHDMAYDRYKDLAKGTESHKVLSDKAFKIASNSKYDGYEKSLASMFYKIFDKNVKVVTLNLFQIKNFQMNFTNQLLENLKDANSIILLKRILGELILLISN